MDKYKTFFLFILCIGMFQSGRAMAYSFNWEWDPPDVLITESHPYYFPMLLPEWDLEQADYTKAVFGLTYVDQYRLDIFIFAADPATDTSVASNYNIMLGNVRAPACGYRASDTVAFNLLTALSVSEFDALLNGQSLLYLVADCHYYFDKASLHLEANAVPIPASLVLLASGLAGFMGLRKRFFW